MKIALVGHGKMGKAIEVIAKQRGHEIVSIIKNADDDRLFDSDEFASADLVIEFTDPESAFDNFRKIFAHHKPIVSGTTGWIDKLPMIKEKCEKEGETFFYASNFSLGVNLFFLLNRHLSKMMNRFPDYDISMEEIHHIHKKDAPSGTAITIADDIIRYTDRLDSWENSDRSVENVLPINSVREGEVPGTHIVEYSSENDSIIIEHISKNRNGFALGAVKAAEFVFGKKGFFTMDDYLKSLNIKIEIDEK